jgi:hypothetical protein
MHLLNTWTIMNIVVWRVAFIVVLFLAANLFVKCVPHISLSGRILMVTGVLFAIAAIAVQAAERMLLILGHWQIAHAAHFFVLCFFIIGYSGIGAGLLGFLRSPRLQDEDMHMANAYRTAAITLFLALDGLIIAVTIIRAFYLRANIFGSLLNQNALSWWIAILCWGAVLLIIELVGLWYLSKSSNRARMIFSSRGWFKGILPIGFIFNSLLYAPLWYFTSQLPVSDAVYLHARLILMVLVYGLGASLLWYGAFPYMAEKTIGLHSVS